MAILDVFRPRRRVVEPPVLRWTQQQWRDIFSFVGGTDGGKRITDALGAYANLGTVFRCATVIRDAGTLAPRLESADGEPVSNAKFEEWIAEPFNGMTWSRWLGLINVHITLSGGCRLVAIDEAQNAMWLMPYSLNTCQVAPGTTFPPQAYRVGSREYTHAQVVEIMPADPVSLYDAIAPAEAALLAAKTAFQTDRHSADTLENGAMIAAVLMLKQSMAPDKFQEFLAKFFAQVKDAEKRAGIVVMDGSEAELHKLGMSLADLKLPELGNMAREEIATAMGVPPALLGDSESRYANFKEQRVTFLEDTLRPRWRLIEDSLTQRLAPMFGSGLKFRLIESDSYIARLLWQEAASAMGLAVGRVVTVNESRKRLGLPDIGPEGDVLERPFTAVTYSAAAAPVPARGAAADTSRAVLSFIRRGKPKRREMTADMRVTYWGKFDRLASRFDSAEDGAYTGKWRKLLKATIAALQDSARENWEKSGTVPYDRGQFDRAALRIRMTVLPAVWREGMTLAQEQLDDAAGKALGTQQVRALSDVIMQKIRARAEHWGEITGDATFEAIDATLGEAASNGWSLQQVMDAIESQAMLQPNRAERIARTEIIGTLNEAHLDTYRTSGGASGKEWLATQDDRTRDEHLAADGQQRDIDEPFDVGGEALQFPGDPSGDPGNIINCRCTLLPLALATADEE